MKKTTEQKTNKDNYINSHEIKIGDITYTVVSHFDDKSNETVEDKTERLISSLSFSTRMNRWSITIHGIQFSAERRTDPK